MSTKLVIINKYKGDKLDWIKKLTGDVIIYNKFDPLIDSTYYKSDQESTRDYYKRLYSIPNYIQLMQPKSTDIPNLVANLGHDAYTFFNHIINNYSTLADINVFLHEDPLHHCDHIDKDFIEQINNLNETTDFISFGAVYSSGHKGEPIEQDLPIGKIYNQLFPDLKIPDIFEFSAGSLFGVSKRNILKHNVDFYQKCLDITMSEPLAAWSFERLYRTIFK